MGLETTIIIAVGFYFPKGEITEVPTEIKTCGNHKYGKYHSSPYCSLCGQPIILQTTTTTKRKDFNDDILGNYDLIAVECADKDKLLIYSNKEAGVRHIERDTVTPLIPTEEHINELFEEFREKHLHSLALLRNFYTHKDIELDLFLLYKYD